MLFKIKFFTVQHEQLEPVSGQIRFNHEVSNGSIVIAAKAFISKHLLPEYNPELILITKIKQVSK